jgi:hypothetical protein
MQASNLALRSEDSSVNAPEEFSFYDLSGHYSTCMNVLANETDNGGHLY